jgi:magnesium and cobalt transporter
MPDGERNIVNKKSNFHNILNRLFSFFQFKRNSSDENLDIDDSSFDDTSLTDFQSLKSEDIMIPRSDIIAVDYNSNLNEISKVFLESKHTRLPVFKKDLDNIIGYINIKDILPYIIESTTSSDFNIKDVIRNLLITSQSMKIFDLLEKMRQTRTHIALVIDEFGGADGLITIEDLVEELIGEIDDEFDSEVNEDFKEISNTSFEVSGRLEIKFLEEKFNISLKHNDEYDTVGGLILSISGNVPEKDTIVIHQETGLTFEIMDSDPRKINKVLVSLN